jgi:predicted hydrocarbon binding protein
MPFRTQFFMENVNTRLRESVRDELEHICEGYHTAKTPLQKARCVKDIMDVLDQKVDEETRSEIMGACGQRCIGASTLKKATKLQEQVSDLDELLELLNAYHIGGGHLEIREGVIHASYDRCYCGSVSKTKVHFSQTYCHCSCGWYQKLFETLLGKPVSVELLSSIIQGDERCEFRIIIINNQG